MGQTEAARIFNSKNPDQPKRMLKILVFFVVVLTFDHWSLAFAYPQAITDLQRTVLETRCNKRKARKNEVWVNEGCGWAGRNR